VSTKQHGFVLVEERDLAEARSRARLWRHEATGAEVLSLVNADENKVFGVALRTPPSDSTGVAHILEHSVLCGSEKYPLKEPFVELLKGSLQTFLNAFTYPDKTCYPVASTNRQDFYNLMDVYLDAVFFPRIDADVLRQEGWHVEVPDAPGDGGEDAPEPAFKGVVYNEMKGAYSSPDSVLAEYTQQALFPDVTYGLDSGGDPAAIPDLTFEAFKEFHRVNYHPSNARFFVYGDADEAENLARIAAYVERFAALRPDELRPGPGLQPRFDAPRFVRRAYAAGPAADFEDDAADEGTDEAEGEAADGAADEAENGGERRRCMLTVSWLLDQAVDVETALALDILEEALTGMPASPLRKALMDSGLGEDLTGGLEDELRQMFLSTGLKGMAEADAGRVEALVLDTLRTLAEDGLGADAIEAALNTVEFDLREMNTGSFPRGLHLWLRSLTTWLHGGDPFAPMAFEAPLAALKARLAAGEPVFEDLIRTRLLDNPHRVTLLLAPDETLQARRDAEERARVAAKVAERAAALRADERSALAELAAETARLAELQEAEDSPEALATLPTLALSDLDPDPRYIPLAVERDRAGCDVLLHDLPTDGIVYLDLAFDLAGLRADDLPVAVLLGRALTEMGTRRRSFVDMGMRIAQKTGGVWPQVATGATLLPGGAPLGLLTLRAKATLDKGPDLLDILGELLLEADLSDMARLRQIVLEEKARQEQRLVPSGHQVVATRLGARRGRWGWMSEMAGGVEFLKAVRRLAARMDTDPDGVRAEFERVRGALVTRARVTANLTLDASDCGAVRDGLSGLLGALPGGGGERPAWEPRALPEREGLAIPAQVNYVGKGFSLFDAGYSFHGSALVIAKHLRTGPLWDRVRVRGGAYGAFALFNQISGAMAFASYRDPNLARTLRVFDECADYLRAFAPTPETLAKAVIGAIGDIDSYMLPDAKGWVSMTRRLSGIDDAYLKRVRDEALATTAEHFREFGAYLAEGAKRGCVTVLGGRAGLEAAEDLEIEDLL
jgi:Zn-dependent M16 (insulinase) family peptidase